MGSPKALLPYRGRTFLEHLLDIAQHPQISPILVVLGPHAEQIQKAVVLDNVTVIVNQNWQQGQLSSIQAAVRHLIVKDESDGLMLFLVDHPFISRSLVDQLVGEFYRAGKSVVLPTFHGKRGHPVIFGRPLYEELLAAPLDQGARTVVWNHADEVVTIPTEEEGVALNLNDPGALERALRGQTPSRHI
jgi:molybdenum cofactor cytidylyltransferase